MHQYTVISNIKMSQNQVQSQNQRAVRVRTCSCCGQSGHIISNCNSPPVLRFKEDALTAAMTASSVETLKLRRPFTNTSLPILKAVAANIHIESSVSNLALNYLIHLLAYSYWNKYNPAGSHATIRDTLSLFQLAETSRQSATNAIREENEARIEQQRFQAQQRQQEAVAAIAERNLQQFIIQQQRHTNEIDLIEAQRRRTRHAFIQAGLPVPPSVAQPFAPATTEPASLLCLCCNSAEHNINNCKNYRGIPSMIKILALVYTRSEFRARLQLHPNLYTHLAFAIQSKVVPAECRDCVVAMNKITDYITGYYYQQAKYIQIRTDLQEYSIEYAYQEETGQPLETNVIYDPRIKFYQSVIETSTEINFNNTNDQDFIAKCICIADTIDIHVNIIRHTIDITLGLKATSMLKVTDEDKDEDEQQCAVCLGAWDIKYPTITFGCNHDMCSRCLNTFFKNPTRPSCHLCRQPVCHISVPSEALNAELFQDIGVRIVRQSSSIIDLTI